MCRRLVGLLVVGLLCLPVPVVGGGTIDEAALLHDSRDDLYRIPTGAVPWRSTVTLRLRAAAGDLDSAAVRVFSTADNSETLWPMRVVTTLPDGYDLWEATVDVGRKATVLWYRFVVSKGEQTLFYEDDTRPDGLVYVPAREGGPGAVYRQSPDLSYQISVYDPDYYTPAWIRNGVVYQIFPDRFRDGDPSNNPVDGSDVFYGELALIFHETWNEPPIDGRVVRVPSGIGYFNSDFYGGDLAGIVEKLDYLQDLGVTGIYLNPIFEARSNHRYDTADYLRIDPILGTLEDFRTLVAEAEARGMKIILDGVFNHLSSDSVFFDRYHRFEADGACESLESPYRSWFFFVPPRAGQPAPCVGEDGAMLYYVSWFGFDSIPKINNSRLEPRMYFFLGEDSVARTWGAEGIGGWRLDVAGDIDNGRDPTELYWEAFRAVVRGVNPEVVIIGEEWHDASEWLLGDEWDSTMNYRLRTAILGFVRDTAYMDNDSNGDNLIRPLAPSEFDALVRAIEEDYPPMAYRAMLNLLGSHDTSRLFFVVGNDVRRHRLAALTQFTLPGAPTIYYGDEIALDAPSVSDGSMLQDDPYNRAPYPWPDTSGDYYPPPDEDMLAFYQRIAAARHANPALREGDMMTLLTDDEKGVYAFLRLDAEAGNAALVVLNKSEAEQTVALSFPGVLPASETMQAVFPAEPVSTTGVGEVVTLPAMSGNIWTFGPTGQAFRAPGPPTSVRAEGEDGRVMASWEAVQGAAGYMVYRSPVALGGFEPVTGAPVQATEWVDHKVSNGFRYYYAVASVGEDGLMGAMSESVLGVPSAALDAVFYVDYEGPVSLPLVFGVTAEVRAAARIEGVTEAEGAAAGVQAQAALVPLGGTPADGDWVPMTYVGEAEGADVYAASLSPQEVGEYVALARFSTDAGLTWTEVTLADGSLPRLTIQASNDTTPPDPPASVVVRRASLSGVALTWETVEDAGLFAYRVYRTGEDGEQVLLAEVPASADNIYVDRGVARGARYTYAVSAVDGALNESAATASEAVVVERQSIPVTFVVDVPDYTVGDVYIAGDFKTGDYPLWDPGGLVMTQEGATRWTITLTLPEGASIEYKFVRGTWEAVEKGPNCEEIANRRLAVALDLTADAEGLLVEHVVEKWRDLDACG